MSTSAPPSALQAAIAPIHDLVAAAFTSHDPSHDMHHVMRVSNTAVALAKAEGLGPDDVALTHIAALLHDACDPKYFKDSSVLDRALQVCAEHPKPYAIEPISTST
jgi:uncharacterized protein